MIICMNLNQITVPSTDVDRSIQFYQKLGLELIVDTHSGYARFLCPDGNSTFSIHQVNIQPSDPGIMVYFECELLDQKVDELKKAGLQFDEGPEDKPWLWREARLKDPDGNQIILFSAGQNRIYPPWRIRTETEETELVESYISHGAIVLGVSDIRNSLDFYLRQLGFTLAFSWGDPVNYAVIKAGQVQIHLTESKEKFQKSHFRRMYIYVYDPDKLHVTYRKNGVEQITTVSIKEYGMKDFDVIDPDGHVLTFGKGTK